MTRLKYNGLSTTLGAGGLTAPATTIPLGAALTHSNGTAVPTLTAGDYIALEIIDQTTKKLVEIVWLTAYTSGQTTGTILRAQEGSPAVVHAAGDPIKHGPTVLDLVAVVSSPGEADYSCRLYLAANASISAASLATVNWTAESYDPQNMHDLSTNPSRVTIPAGGDGKYLASVATHYSATSGQTQTRIYKNGTLVSINLQDASGGTITGRAIEVLDLVAGDYLDVRVYVVAGGSVFGTTTDSSFTVIRVAPSGPGVSGTVIATKEVTGSATYTNSTTVDADVDPTNAAVTFTVPPSGVVLVTLEGLSDSAGAVNEWSLREGSTLLLTATLGTSYSRHQATFRVTGLTPGATKTYKWGFHRLGTGTSVTIYTGGAGGSSGNMLMTVTAV